MDFPQALKNPGRMFRAPEDVEASTEFNAAQKRAILVHWKDHLVQLQKATEENMPGPESDGVGADCLRRVADALTRLTTERHSAGSRRMVKALAAPDGSPLAKPQLDHLAKVLAER